MEENKLKVAKSEETEVVLSYDELKAKHEELAQQAEKLTNYVNQLYAQNQQLQNTIQRINTEEINIQRIFKRLEFLFKTLENAAWFSDEFISTVAKEIEDTLTIKNEENKDTEEEEPSDEAAN